MKPRLVSALGVDMSETHISLALIRSDRKKPRLVKAATVPVPEGAIVKGIIQDTALLQKTLQEVKKKCRIRSDEAVVSLLAEPSLLQVVEMPDVGPAQLGQAIHKEVKQYVTLAGDQIVYDYCGLNLSLEAGRILALAANAHGVEDLALVCQRARVNLETIEPSLLGYARILYGYRVEAQFGCNTVLILLRDGRMTTCVFREHVIDFVRTISIEHVRGPSDALGKWIQEEIGAVIQYYDIDIEDAEHRWTIDVVVDRGMSLSKASQNYLQNNITQGTLSILTSDTIIKNLDLDMGRRVDPAQASVAAIGHAMRLLKDSSIPKVDLLPQRIREMKKIKRHGLVAAIAAGGLFFLMGVLVVYILLTADKKLDRIAKVRPEGDVGDVNEMVETKKQLEAKIEQVARVPKWIKEVTAAKPEVNWGDFLADINDITPNSMRITKMVSDKENNSLVIEGHVIDLKGIAPFIQRLNESDYVISAEMSLSQRRRPGDYLIPYRVSCLLKAETGI